MKKTIRYTFYSLAGLIVLLLVYYRVWFLRQPERNIPNNESVFVSPANGTIVSINPYHAAAVKIEKGELGAINTWTKDVDTVGTIISIQMNVANVHYQRAPLSAKVINEVYTKGDFNNAVVMSNEYGIRFENEHNEMLFETANGTRFKLIQIAGFVARRIEDYVSKDQQVKQGDVIGLIKLGSQVTVVLPHTLNPNVKLGDVVIEGETVLAK